MPFQAALASRALRMAVLVAAAVGVVTGFLAWLQVEWERGVDLEDIDKRAAALAYQMADRLRDPLSRPDFKVEGVSLEGFRRLLGYSLFGADGRMVAAGKAVAEFTEELAEPVRRAIVEGEEIFESIRAHGSHVHVLAYPINDPAGRLTGVLTVLHDITHLDERAAARLTQFAFWILIVTLLLVTLVVGGLWLAYDRPLKNLAEWMRRLRLENVPESPPVGLPVALLGTESSRLAASFRAARSAGWAESRALVREHNLWTRERLRAQAVDALRMGQLVVVSNREPYMHQFREGKPGLIVPAGGLVTALDPVLQACGGLWVAHGAGDADRETADAGGRLTVPPSDPRYTLRRVWLTREEEQGYYYGLANEGLWPLCHLAHERPVFRASDWEHYVRANRKFAAAVLEEIGSGEATVLVQDYHLALLPQLLKAERPDIRVGIFWHIPWPNPEAFRICPWRVEVLQGMLGADLIGFHLQQYSNNFLDTVDRMVEARLNWDHFAVELKGRTSLVRPFPISVESWTERNVPAGEALERQIVELRKLHKLGMGTIAVGVDRIDYTKGLPERFRAISRFFEKNPRHRGKLTFVQLGAPSRTHLRRYRDLISELESLADEINWRFETEDWKPIRFLVGHHGAPEVHAFMCMASTCIVSSLHDGMNLVAKEYAAAKEDLDGVLILSEFAGAARELSEALIINPYDIEQFAEAIRVAVEMEKEERRRRMEQLRRGVEERNIYWWAAKFLTELAATRSAREGPQEAGAEEPIIGGVQAAAPGARQPGEIP